MKWDDLSQEPCSVARTVSVIGERWTLLVLRDCFLGVRRFEDFQVRLGISRSITAQRLDKLVEEGVLRRIAYQDRPLRFEYRLTDKGFDLHPVIMSIVHFGDKHYSGDSAPPLLHRHKLCGCDFAPVTTCSACGDPVHARDVEVRPSPGNQSG